MPSTPVKSHAMPTVPEPQLPPTSKTTAPRRARVVLLFGGRSGEHVISCATAAGVMRAIDRDRFDVIPVGITRSGQWVVAADDPDLWAISEGHLPEVVATDREVLLPMATGERALRELVPGELPAILGDVDVVFPLLHGPFGEDGTLQGMLELADVRYVGAGVLASAVGMDKHFMKLVLAGQGLPIGPFAVIRPGEWDANPKAWTESIANLGLPVFVKPARAGSSLGISKVNDLADLPAAIAEARKHDPKVIVEAGIVGREIECAVLGGRTGQRPRASLPGEIEVTDLNHDFYTFEAKYLDEASVVLTCPADLPSEIIAEVQDVAVRTFEAVAAEGLSRVDVFVTPTGKVIVNEINTMPGFTPFSMYPRMWEKSGLGYSDLITELLELALERPTGLR
ncbi:D-alanine-D-alanine ligase [Sanguibacter gelidistatuariae]|uniref:D-alanine--D-alanine ligase n=2 Tax=Sanguibacter gelidistatuariae TaxID=1814289 RepID=A0A1G6WGD6_9MICO|nr:D-alanine-D-alanine ligase [Sanguibacter gelidistatuariae]